MEITASFGDGRKLWRRRESSGGGIISKLWKKLTQDVSGGGNKIFIVYIMMREIAEELEHVDIRQYSYLILQVVGVFPLPAVLLAFIKLVITF